MNLTKNIWKKKDISKFEHHINSLINKDKIAWTKNIVRTNKSVLAIKTPILREIAKEIMKGNYISYIIQSSPASHENVMINGIILSKMNNFNDFKNLLERYIPFVDNWATCDVLLSLNKNLVSQELFNLAQDFIRSNELFRRRIGIIFLFKFIESDIEKVFNTINTLNSETEYYVNMAVAWLICECMIKQREKTLNFLNRHNLNNFTINKAIQKCRDSFRISKEDKEYLLNYKTNIK